jgi:hypothetical protein
LLNLKNGTLSVTSLCPFFVVVIFWWRSSMLGLIWIFFHDWCYRLYTPLFWQVPQYLWIWSDDLILCYVLPPLIAPISVDSWNVLCIQSQEIAPHILSHTYMACCRPLTFSPKLSWRGGVDHSNWPHPWPHTEPIRVRYQQDSLI